MAKGKTKSKVKPQAKAKAKIETKAKARIQKKVKATAKTKMKADAKADAKTKIKVKPKIKSKAKIKTPVQGKAKARVLPKSKPKSSKSGLVKKAATAAAKTNPKTSAPNGKLATLVSKIVPLDDRVLIKPTLTERVTPGGLILPETSTLEGNLRGAVLAVGRGHQDKKGRVRPLDLRVGDEVLFSEYAGSPVEVSGEKLVILRETDILGVINR